MNVPKHRLENVCNRIRGLYVSTYYLSQDYAHVFF